MFINASSCLKIQLNDYDFDHGYEPQNNVENGLRPQSNDFDANASTPD